MNACVSVCETLGIKGNLLVFQQGHAASMTHRVQRSYGHGWEGKADHLPVPAVCECSNHTLILEDPRLSQDDPSLGFHFSRTLGSLGFMAIFML